MWNLSTVKVVDRGTKDLGLTFGKILTLMYCRYQRFVKNIVFGDLLIKHGFKLVFESDEFILTKNENVIGKLYATGEMIIVKINNNASSTCIIGVGGELDL